MSYDLLKEAVIKQLAKNTGKGIVGFVKRGPLQGDVAKVAKEQGLSPRTSNLLRVLSIAEGPISSTLGVGPAKAAWAVGTATTKSMTTGNPGRSLTRKTIDALGDATEQGVGMAIGGAGGSGIIGTLLGVRAGRWRNAFVKKYGRQPTGNQLAKFIKEYKHSGPKAIKRSKVMGKLKHH